MRHFLFHFMAILQLIRKQRVYVNNDNNLLLLSNSKSEKKSKRKKGN